MMNVFFYRWIRRQIEKKTRAARATRVSKRCSRVALGRLGGLTRTSHRTEAFLELVDASLCIHKLIAAGKEGVRVRRNAAGYYIVLHAIDFFRFGRLYRGASDETASRGDVHENDRVIIGMQFFFHSVMCCVSIAAWNGVYHSFPLCQGIIHIRPKKKHPQWQFIAHHAA